MHSSESEAWYVAAAGCSLPPSTSSTFMPRLRQSRTTHAQPATTKKSITGGRTVAFFQSTMLSRL